MKIKVETRIVPAIITKTQSELEGTLKRLKGKVKRVQLDVMDGEYVPNSSLDFDFQLPKGFEYEAHLMVKNPLGWVNENAEKVDMVTMHVETLKDIGAAIEKVIARGVKVSLALTPETKIETVKPYLSKIDGLLVMTVIPGSYCVKKNFRPEALEKIKRVREINRYIPIEVDGCMNPTNASLARKAGANTFVSGSYILKSTNIDKALKELEEAVDLTRARV
jgi:ribulose-phosphate 3-epimerase